MKSNVGNAKQCIFLEFEERNPTIFIQAWYQISLLPKGPGIIMDGSLKITLQNLAAVKKGRKTVSKRIENQKIILPSHNSVVHLHHEYRMQF